MSQNKDHTFFMMWLYMNVILALISGITMICKSLWVYKWFRWTFTILLIGLMAQTFITWRTWDGFAPLSTINNPPITITYNRAEKTFRLTNNHKEKWLEKIIITCNYTYKNGESAGSRNFYHTFGLDTSYEAWVPPMSIVDIWEADVYTSHITNERLSNNVDCWAIKADYRYVYDQSKYQIVFGFKDYHVFATVKNPHDNKEITGIEAVCKSGNKYVTANMIAIDAPTTPPGKLGQYRTKTPLTMVEQPLTNCVPVRVKAWND